MTANDQSRSRLLRWLQNLVVITVIALLVMELLNMGIFHDRWGWKAAEREVLIKRFNEDVMLARTEWLRNGKPAEITLRTQQQSQQLMMNRAGWPSIDNGCRRLWQILAGGRFDPSFKQDESQCYFTLQAENDDQIFNLMYNAATGQLKSQEF